MPRQNGWRGAMQSNWERFSTDNCLSKLRRLRWTEFGSTTLSEMHVEPKEGCDFRAEIFRRDLGSMGMVSLRTSPAFARSLAVIPGDWAAAQQDSLCLTVANSGLCKISQASWSADLAPGDIVVRDLCRPWESHSTEQTDLILVKIPFVNVAKICSDPVQLIGRHLSGKDPAVGLASTVLRATCQASLADPDGHWHAHLPELISGILRLLVNDDHASDFEPSPFINQQTFRKTIGFIARNLRDPELSVSMVANAVGVSNRQLQRLFLPTGTTPRQYIVQERLALAASELSSGNIGHNAKIVDIAFNVGFNDASHFSRSFAARYGCVPREYRSGARAPS
jgi:AraC-like DNA-binding protein